MPIVLNKRRDGIPKGAVLVDRTTKWGNPFRLERESERAEVLQCYREWIVQQPQLLRSLHELRGRDLVCWCAPKLCHADVLLEMANVHIDRENLVDSLLALNREVSVQLELWRARKGEA